MLFLRSFDRGHLVVKVLLDHFGALPGIELLGLDLLRVDGGHPRHLLQDVVPVAFLHRPGGLRELGQLLVHPQAFFLKLRNPVKRRFYVNFQFQ